MLKTANTVTRATKTVKINQIVQSNSKLKHCIALKTDWFKQLKLEFAVFIIERGLFLVV